MYHIINTTYYLERKGKEVALV